MNRSGYSCNCADFYLGDGVYLKFEDCQVWLITQSGDAIALDYPMVNKLKDIYEIKRISHSEGL